MKRTIYVADRTGDKTLEVKALVYCELFAIHENLDVKRVYNVTHLPTGGKLAIFKTQKDAKIAVNEVLGSVAVAQYSELYDVNPHQASKSKKLRAIYDYLNAASKVATNRDLEALAGAFYGDRADLAAKLQALRQ